MPNVLWLNGQSCGGDNISLLNAEQPDVISLIKKFDIRFLWHPNLSRETGADAVRVLEDILAARIRMDILIVSGSVPLGPHNTGGYFLFHHKPIKDWLQELAPLAQYTVAVGTCASFGGIPAAGYNNPTDAVGLQFLHNDKGGLLGPEYRSKKGLPVINVPGCPPHPDWMVETLMMIVADKISIEVLDPLQRPRIFYQSLAHHGCPRNEYYEFKASAQEYGQIGCLFENLGCNGTCCSSDCNIRLWLGRTGSCTRGGYPCIACTGPRFPDEFKQYFRTQKISGIPTTLPYGVPKAWYVAISSMGKAAIPIRLKKSATSFTRGADDDQDHND